MNGACEKCWADASANAFYRGGSVTDHYWKLLEERAENPCSVAQQLGQEVHGAGGLEGVPPDTEGHNDE